jgi:arylsulfatase A-like enzyme
VTELCGFAPPPHVEGQSLAPLLGDPARPWKTAAFTQVTAPDGIVGRAVRTDRYRYIRWEGPHPDEELYDHQTDPNEHANLARNKANAPLTTQMRGILEAGWRAAKAKV